MKVDGNAFKKVRERIRARFPGRGETGQPAPGTQEWLAEEAKISLRAVQYLEKGEASIKTLKAVSKVLKINNWEEYIEDYGVNYVTCTVNKFIDFRPELFPRGYPDEYMNSIMLMTIDPLSIVADSGKFERFRLKEITAELTGLEQTISFSWFAVVSLTHGMDSWLGWVNEAGELDIEANNESVTKPIMFRQLTTRVSWADFIKMVEASNESHFNVDLHFKFVRFDKHVRIYVSIDLLQRLFDEGRKKYNKNWPYRAQLKTISERK